MPEFINFSTYYVQVGKSQKVFSIWPHPQTNQITVLKSAVSIYSEIFRVSDLFQFFED